jgi:ribonuclease HI
MNEPIDLDTIAYKSERSASRRLARAHNLSDADALQRTLEQNAGSAGLAALVAGRLALQAADAARQAARAAARSTANAQRAARHDGRPTAWRAWFDGSARPNPGRCGIGALLRGPDGVAVELALPVGHGNSSEAEYLALIALLETAVAQGAHELTVYGDSRVVIDDVTGPGLYAAPALADYRSRVHALLAHLPDVRLRWVPRHKNLEADALSQRALDTPPAIHLPDESDAIDLP